jgi:hypothetical protein
MRPHWRRRSFSHPRRQRVDDAAKTLVLTLIAGALATATTGLSVFAQLNELGPIVGNILVFKRSEAMTDWWRVKATIDDRAFATWQSGGAVRTCDLSPSAMVAGGGSLVVEARRMSSPPVYRVHWAGKYTSHGPSNCGTSADLVVSRSDLMRLADVAGGFDSNFGMATP